MRCNNKGFSVLELVVIVGVIAIISAVATPSVLTWRVNTKLRSAAQELRGAVQLARSRAIQEGKTVIVDLETDNYIIFVDKGDDSGGSPNGSHDPAEPLVHDQQLPAGIQLKFKITKTGTPAPPMVFEGSALRNYLVNQARHLSYHSPKVGSLFAMDGFSEKKIHFKPHSSRMPQPNWELWYDGEYINGIIVQWPSFANQIIFNPNGRCLSPQSVLVVNVNGKKMLLSVSPFGVAKVTKVDDSFGE